ncbi:hypothetical protein ACFQ5D_16980 [Paenibacillus farraposensis]|uniref:Uncharacterized protein n=1 Tax=Paenibacillus farraposensis TaxID=2807095 RepID=A0ABW4DES8_9BACL|nr:hypothetical protein [Paenibacillus farraposensis]MCC3378730.1 hypothetical protein [Paenibacillus farraposensis]
MPLIKDSKVTTKENNIVLFPKTLDYYQIQLTVMLENERYGDAMAMLRFLIRCQGQEQKQYDEWNALLQWLEAAFPQYVDSGSVTGDVEEDEVGEVELARRHARFKQEQDAGYGSKLLQMAMEGPLSEQTILALEQLSYLELPEIDDALLRWIKEREIHPLLQFRILQTLRRRGMEGTIQIRRGDEKAEIDIETVPLQPGEFPEPITRILERVADQTEVHEPTLFYFAQELWSQFVMAVYGTNDYRSMLAEEDGMLDIWAAALHQTVSESLKGSHNEEETRAIYGITDALRFRFEQAYRSMRLFVAAGMNTP